MANILPDSRLREPKGAVRYAGMNFIPVYCALCGAPHGYVPEETCRFACWLCDDCAEAHGREFAAYVMPDEIFWEKVREEMREKFGRALSRGELEEIRKHGTTALAKLLREGSKIKGG